jgi:arabinan endo-1,5-alpha-L-arabinosidase
MDAEERLRASSFTNPVPGVILGDPFVLRHRGRFYLYGTNDGPELPDGRKIPVFRSDDLLHWDLLGGALEPVESGADHWAPEVLAWNGRLYMVVSFGDVERRGHALWVAVADRPEGPFQLKSRVSDVSEVFSIDGSWLLDDDGRLYLFRCLDFVDEQDPPSGTGIVVQPMHDPFTPSGPPIPVLRAHSPWHLFLADRTMHLYGGRTFAEWTTIEGPAPVRRAGRYFCGYSGGNYAGEYGTGEVSSDSPLGPYTDRRGRSGPIFGTVPGLVDGPGHFSVIRPDLVHDWIVLHGRRPGEGRRCLWLCPAHWEHDGVTIGPLTDQSQPAPPLPTVQYRFDDHESFAAGWRCEGGRWELTGEALRQDDATSSVTHAWREAEDLEGPWVAEVDIRFPEITGQAGLEISSPASGLRIAVDGAGGTCAVQGLHHQAEGLKDPSSFASGTSAQESRVCRLPTLGDEPFHPAGWHTLEVRARAGRAVLRLDGVLLFEGLQLPQGAARLGLVAASVVEFGALAVTLGGVEE